MTSASSLHSFAVTASSESCFVLPKLFNPLLHFLLHSHQYLPLMMGCPAPLPDVGLPLICQCAWNAVELVACCKALSCGLTGELGSNYMLHAMCFFFLAIRFQGYFLLKCNCSKTGQYDFFYTLPLLLFLRRCQPPTPLLLTDGEKLVLAFRSCVGTGK